MDEHTMDRCLAGGSKCGRNVVVSRPSMTGAPAEASGRSTDRARRTDATITTEHWVGEVLHALITDEHLSLSRRWSCSSSDQ